MIDNERLATLFDVEHRVRGAQDATTLQFIAVNESRRVVAYTHAALFEPGVSGWRITALSDVASVDRNSLFVQWAERVFTTQASDDTTSVVDVDALGEWEQGVWPEVSPPHATLVPLAAPGRSPAAWLWLASDSVFSEAEASLIAHIAEVFGHAFDAFRRKRYRRRWWTGLKRRRTWLIAALVLAGIAAVPVHLSALAPGEIVARDPAIVAAPLDGIVEKVLVKPNQHIKSGQALVRLDDLKVHNKYDVASMQLQVAKARYDKARQESFDNEKSRAALATRRAEVALRKAQKHYAKQKVDRVVLRADHAGIAIFNDPDNWAGRPVTTGQRIMQLADPQKREVRIRLPVDDALLLSKGAKMKLFLNSHPLAPVGGTIQRVAYKPEIDDRNNLVYRVTARLSGSRDWLRIGLRGTAKVSGARVPLIYYLLRRPIAALRQAVGY